MGVCFSVCARSRSSTAANVSHFFTSNPWERELPERENIDAMPKYYRDKAAREEIEMRKKLRLKREKVALKALKENPKNAEEAQSDQPSADDAMLNQDGSSRESIDEVKVDERPEVMI